MGCVPNYGGPQSRNVIKIGRHFFKRLKLMLGGFEQNTG